MMKSKLWTLTIWMLLSLQTFANSLIVKTTDLPGLKMVLDSAKITKLFPLAKDLALQNVYLAKLIKPRRADSYLGTLNAMDSVEYAFVDHMVAPHSIETVPKLGSGREDLFDYQWALKNHGQIVSYPLDSDYPVSSAGLPGFDIDWSYLHAVDQKFPGVSIVAVLDSGLDLEHPDLKGAILHNPESSCEGEDDPYPGLCNGINFAALIKQDEPSVVDAYGHGTHIAGILAARNNDFGVTGVSQNIKILPVKVFLDRSEYDTLPETESEIYLSVLSSNVYRGLYYAMIRGASVINLSLGWPPLLDNPLISDILTIAQRRDVAIVAASGNDGSFSQVKPCALDHVICVGFSNHLGKVSPFSNHGGHVDFFAPGFFILSTFPKNKTKLYPAFNYEYMTGSSQAAPYIAGLIAIAKRAYPEASVKDIVEKMHQSSLSAYPKGRSLFPAPRKVFSGQRPEEIDFFSPSLKNLEVIEFDQDLKADLHISFSYRGLQALENSKIRFTSLDKGFKITSQECVRTTDSMGLCKLQFQADNGVGNTLEIDLEFQSAGLGTRKIRHHTHASFRPSKTEELFLESLTEDELIDIRAATPSLFGMTSSLYFYQWGDKAKFLDLARGGAAAHLFQYDLRSTESALALYTGDFDYDKLEDLLLVTGVYKTSKKRVQIGLRYHYLNKAGEELVPGLGVLSLAIPEIGINVLNLSSLQWLPTRLGKDILAVPVLWGVRIFFKDDSLRPIYGPQTDSTQAMFTFKITDCTHGRCLSPVLIDNNLFYYENRQKQNQNFARTLLSRSLLQSKSDFYRQRASFILRSGAGLLPRWGKLSVDANLKFSYQAGSLDHASFIGQKLSPVMSQKTGELVGFAAFHSGISTNSISYFNKDTLKLEAMDFKNEIGRPSLGLLMSYFDEEGRLFHLTSNRSEMSLRNQGTETLVDRVDTLKNTIVPFVSFVQSFYPMMIPTISETTSFTPTLFVEESKIEAGQSHYLSFDNQKINTSLKLKFRAPDGCRVENSAVNRVSGGLAHVFLCHWEDLENMDKKRAVLRWHWLH